MKIELGRKDAVDLIVMLINYHALIDAFYENIEPTGQKIDKLNKDIMRQLLEDGLILTDVELIERTSEMAKSISGLRF